jgi:hypothetical protein
MENFKLINIVFILVLLSLFLSAQNTNQGAIYNLKNALATSPEAALLGRFGDIPVSNYTGTADISVPLWTIKEDNLEIPIALKYCSSGIKVEDEATWVGLGWSLNPAGSIIQIPNGIVDEFDDIADISSQGYQAILSPPYYVIPPFWERPEDQNGVWPGSSEDGLDDSFTVMTLAIGRGQPDIYFYNFGSYSGKFYKNPITKKIVFLDKRDEISFEQLDAYNWTAQTIDGNKYVFSEVEYSCEVSQFPDYRYVGQTWNLIKIELSNHKTINFKYSDGGYKSYLYSENYRDPAETIPPDMYNGYIRDESKEVFNRTKYLNEISTDDTKIVFNLDFSNRLDMIPFVETDGQIRKTPLLSSMDIYSLVSNKIIKSYQFTYSYFPYSTVGGNYLVYSNDLHGKRLRLDSIKEIGYSIAVPQLPDNSKPPYKFFYNSIELPLKTSYAKDYWGYYNGKNNNRLTPDLSFLHYSGANPEYQILPEHLFNGTIKFTGRTPSEFADRSVDTALSRAGMLTMIEYPTGGSTSFNYESNEFSNYSYPLKSQINNSTHDITLMDKNEVSDNLSNTISLTRTSIVHFHNSINKGTPWQTATFQEMLPSYIVLNKLYWGNGSNPTITQMIKWQMTNNIETQNKFNNEGKIEWNEDVPITLEPNTSYEVRVYLPNELGPQDNSTGQASVISHFTYYNIPDSYLTKSYGGGVRVNSIINYSYDKKIINGKTYKYSIISDPNITSGLLMSPLSYIYKRNHFRADYVCINEPFKGNKFEISNSSSLLVYFMSSESNIPFSNSAIGNIIGYSNVEVSAIEGNGIGNGKVIQTFHNVPNITFPCIPDIPDLLNGKLIHELYLNNAGNPVKNISYTFENIMPQTSFIGIKCFNATDVDPYAIYYCCDPSCMNLDPFMRCWPCLVNADYVKRYSLVFYKLESQWNVIQNKTITEYYPTGNISTLVGYTYNNIGQSVEIQSTNSKNQLLKNKYLFPIDDISPRSILLTQNHLYDRLLTQSTILVSDVSVSDVKEEIFYDYDVIPGSQNIIAETSVRKKIANSSLFDLVNYDLWDIDKNLLQFTEREIRTTIIMGYNNTYPIAETKNATTTECGHTGFEDSGYNGWNASFSMAITSGDLIKTGRKSVFLYDETGASKIFDVGKNAENHSGYKATVWVKKGIDIGFIEIGMLGQHLPVYTTQAMGMIGICLKLSCHK